MADAAPALRRTGPVPAHAIVSFTLAPPMTRLSARGGAEAARRMGRVFGVDLPAEALRAGMAGDRAALWLGPDEWLLLAPDAPDLVRHVSEGLAGEPGCVVDVSHRQVGIDIVGEGAATVLNAGCPLDLDEAAFPSGMCTRTVLGKADVVLWRRARDRFTLECWRSFTPYVLAFLKLAADQAGE